MKLVLGTLALALAACHPASVSSGAIEAIQVRGTAGMYYMIDTDLHACMLTAASWAVPIDCAQLAQRVPAAAPKITWLAPPAT